MLNDKTQIYSNNSDRISKLVEVLSDIVKSNQQEIQDHLNFHQLERIHDQHNSGIIVAKKLYRIRRTRDHFFHYGLFSEPAWDILLDMYIAHSEMRQSTVKTVSLASCVAMTTALRWIKILEEANLISSHKSPHDKRVRMLSLTREGIKTLNKVFSEMNM